MSELTELLAVTETLKEQSLGAHRKNLQESQRISGELGQIDSMRVEAQKNEHSLALRQAVGADTVWQGWLLRRRSDLLQQAAMARAQEMDSLAQARLAFARAQASEVLRSAELAEIRQRQMAREAERLEELGTLLRSRE